MSGTMAKWLAAQGRTDRFTSLDPSDAPNPVEEWKSRIQVAMFELGHAPAAFTLDRGCWWVSPQLPESVFTQDEIDAYWDDLLRACKLAWGTVPEHMQVAVDAVEVWPL